MVHNPFSMLQISSEQVFNTVHSVHFLPIPSTSMCSDIQHHPRSTRLNRRGWHRQHFVDHPGYQAGDPDAVSGTGDTRDKVKIWCIRCLERQVEQVMASERFNVAQGICGFTRSEAEIRAEREYYLTCHRRVSQCHSLVRGGS